MRAAITLLAALALSGCGGSSSNPPLERETPEVRAELERVLARTSVGVCDGECRTFQARAASCTGDPVELEGRPWFRCRVEYRPAAGRTPAPDEICAALDERDGHVARPIDECVAR